MFYVKKIKRKIEIERELHGAKTSGSKKIDI
jgi:hypothetical protein